MTLSLWLSVLSTHSQLSLPRSCLPRTVFEAASFFFLPNPSVVSPFNALLFTLCSRFWRLFPFPGPFGFVVYNPSGVRCFPSPPFFPPIAPFLPFGAWLRFLWVFPAAAVPLFRVRRFGRLLFRARPVRPPLLNTTDGALPQSLLTQYNTPPTNTKTFIFIQTTNPPHNPTTKHKT